MKILQENKKAISLGLGLVAFGAVIPNLNNFTRFWASHEIAYAAQQEIKDVQQYITKLDTYIQLQQQQMQQTQPRNFNFYEEQDSRGNWWCCDTYNGRDCLEQWYRC